MPSASSPFHCGNENRRALVRTATNPLGDPLLNGIDFLEIASPDQRTLRVRFLHPLPGQPGGVPDPAPALTPDQIVIEGGVRLTRIQVLALALAPAAADLVVTVDAAGDFSPYTLRLRRGPTDDRPPLGFDPRLAAVAFSFKASCPSDFDCRPACTAEPPVPEPPRIDYQARDYASYRRLLLDRFRILQPDWSETSPADFPVAVIELLSYIGDHLHYRLDAAATEQYLGLARHRPSVRRHARLLDYRVHEGCNARAWIQFDVEPGSGADGAILPVGTRVVAGSAEQRQLAAAGELERLDLRAAVVFETMLPLLLRPQHNAFRFHTWSDDDCTLCAGATAATLVRPAGATLAPGDVLVLEEARDPDAGPDTLLEGRLEQRHAVRLTRVESTLDPLDDTPLYEVEWSSDDAPPFAFVLSRRIGGVLVPDITLARGNVALADHGLTFAGPGELEPAQVPAGTASYRPRLQRADLTARQPLPVADTQAQTQAIPSARALLAQTPALARPELTLESEGEAWNALPDLLGSDENAAGFVVETDNRRRSFLRFGDGEHGRRPSVGQVFSARLRAGNGTAGNVGPESLQTVVFPDGGIRRARNPLPAVGGTDPEPLAEVKQFAPVAFRTQKRAVTAEDYAAVAALHPGVQRAHAVFRHLASWYTVFVAVDRLGGLPLDDEFRAGLRRHLETHRLAGYDLEIVDPIHVALDVQLAVCLARGANRTETVRQLAERLGSGPRGLFHPDRLTFAQCIQLSRLVATAMAVPGVASARVTRFQRFARSPAGELDAGFIQAAPREILRLDNDPSFPEHGRLEFVFPGETNP